MLKKKSQTPEASEEGKKLDELNKIRQKQINKDTHCISFRLSFPEK